MFAGCFRNQHASVARGSVQETMLVLALRIVLRTDGIVRTQLRRLEGGPDMFVNPPANLYQTAESTFGVAASRVKENTKPNGREGVDAFAYRTRRISALQ